MSEKRKRTGVQQMLLHLAQKMGKAMPLHATITVGRVVHKD